MFDRHYKFSEALHPEFLKIERKRVGIILGLFIFSTLLIPFVHAVYPDLMRQYMNQMRYGESLFFWSFLFIAFEITVYLRIDNAIKKKIPVPKKILIPNILVEFGLPAIVLYQTIKFDYSLLILEYDGLVFYFILLMLSAMHLDLKISLGAGLLAAIGYFSVAFWGINYLNPDGDLLQLKEIYTMRSIGLLISGAIAGVVASEIRKRVNNYLNSIQEQKEMESLLGQQLSKSVANELIMHKNDSIVRKVTGSIMFLDIRNFTDMADHQTPEETIAFQNAVFDPLIRIIEKNNGSIHQILGDGFMASFGIALPNSNHAKDAYQAGVEIVAAINHLRTDEDGKKTQIGIGLHCGEVVTGNIGNELRKQFSIAGRNVIIASRLEQLNKKHKSQFIISQQLVDCLKKTEDFICLGSEKLKGIDEKIRIYAVRCCQSDAEILSSVK